MTGRDAAEILGMVERLGVRVWVGGGWAADALRGRQTRHHADLDIVIEQKDVDAVVDMLQTRGYRRAHPNDLPPWNISLGDGVRRQVDVHVVVIDERGNAICGQPADGAAAVYPSAALRGVGAIHGRVVHCIAGDAR